MALWWISYIYLADKRCLRFNLLRLLGMARGVTNQPIRAVCFCHALALFVLVNFFILKSVFSPFPHHRRLIEKFQPTLKSVAIITLLQVRTLAWSFPYTIYFVCYWRLRWSSQMTARHWRNDSTTGRQASCPSDQAWSQNRIVLPTSPMLRVLYKISAYKTFTHTILPATKDPPFQYLNTSNLKIR